MFKVRADGTIAIRSLRSFNLLADKIEGTVVKNGNISIEDDDDDYLIIKDNWIFGSYSSTIRLGWVYYPMLDTTQ